MEQKNGQYSANKFFIGTGRVDEIGKWAVE